MRGLWAIHWSKNITITGKERFRRWPMRYIAFNGPGWCLYETRWKRRIKRAGISRGVWRIVDVDRHALLVLIVQSYRPSNLLQAFQEPGDSSASVMIAHGVQAARETEDLKMRGGEARMCFTPVNLQPGEVILALPSDGRSTPLQRWARVSELMQ